MFKKICFSLFILSGVIFSQNNSDTLKCNMNVVREFKANMESEDNQYAIKFFKTFCDSCDDDWDFPTFSSEILWKFLKHHPERFIEVLSLDEGYDMTRIMKEIKEPARKGLGIRNVYTKILKMEIDTPLVKELLKNMYDAEYYD